MNHWMGETRLEVESFILKGTGVIRLDDFAAHHDQHLVSLAEEPKEAARWWHFQSDKTNPGEGWISMRLGGDELMPLDAWTNLEHFWSEMLSAVESYLATGEGSGGFRGEAAEFSLARKGSVAIFDLRGRRHAVEPESFLASLLSGARQFYAWADEHVGTFDASYLGRVQDAMNALDAF